MKTAMPRSRVQIIAFAVALLVTPACSTLQKTSRPGDVYPEATVLSKDTHSWDGNLLPAYPAGQPEITILRISIPPGAALKVHEHPVINAAVLTSGDLNVVKTDGQTLKVQAGDSFIELVNSWHYGVNPGKVPAELIVFYAGVAGDPITVFQPKPENARPAFR